MFVNELSTILMFNALRSEVVLVKEEEMNGRLETVTSENVVLVELSVPVLLI